MTRKLPRIQASEVDVCQLLPDLLGCSKAHFIEEVVTLLTNLKCLVSTQGLVAAVAAQRPLAPATAWPLEVAPVSQRPAEAASAQCPEAQPQPLSAVSGRGCISLAAQ